MQVITPLPYDPWRLGRLSRSQAWENAKTALPIHVGHAAGCKVCYYGKDPCPICMYVLPCEFVTRVCYLAIFILLLRLLCYHQSRPPVTLTINTIVYVTICVCISLDVTSRD